MTDLHVEDPATPVVVPVTIVTPPQAEPAPSSDDIDRWVENDQRHAAHDAEQVRLWEAIGRLELARIEDVIEEEEEERQEEEEAAQLQEELEQQEEEQQAPPEQDEEPENEHSFFRSWGGRS